MTDLEKLVTSMAARGPASDKFGLIARLCLGLALGSACAIAVILALGGATDLTTGSAGFGIPVAKVVYATALAASAAALSIQFASPEIRPTRRHLLALAPVVMMAMVAMSELFTTPVAQWLHLMTGFGVSSCITTILLAAPPIFAGLAWSFRRFAPADLRSAGAVIGALSGATAGALYAAVSGDASACFVFIWYSFSILITAVAGAVFGRFFLRW